MKKDIEELAKIHEEFQEIDNNIKRIKSENNRNNRRKNIGLNCYATISEDGLPTVHDLVYGSHKFQKLSEAIDFYQMLCETEPYNIEYEALLYQLNGFSKPLSFKLTKQRLMTH